MNRYTFVIQVHADGPSTLENLSTTEVVRVPDLAAVGTQIERWLSALSEPSPGTTPDREGRPVAADPSPR